MIQLYKRGDRVKMENYRDISLLNTAYKIYGEIIRNRKERIVEEKKVLPESQAGFRKERSTIDNIFVLNHLVQRERLEKDKEGRKKEEGNIYALFVDVE